MNRHGTHDALIALHLLFCFPPLLDSLADSVEPFLPSPLTTLRRIVHPNSVSSTLSRPLVKIIAHLQHRGQKAFTVLHHPPTHLRARNLP